MADTSNGPRLRFLRDAGSITMDTDDVERVDLNALGGDDVVDAEGLSAGVIKLRMDGGNGDDILQGSAGDDVMAGGAGDDVLIGGPWQDVLAGGPGSNVVVQ